MSLSSPFDVARSTHEEAERYTAALSSVLATLPSSSSSSAPPSRSTLTNSHIASILVDRIVSRNRNLVDFYKDETGIRKEEVDLLSGRPTGGEGNAAGSSSAAAGSSATTSEVMSLFYSRLNHIKSYHEKYPSAPPEMLTLDIPALENSIAPSTSSSIGVTTSAMDRLFSGEEGLGRYLDLNEYHSQYINLKGVKRCNYLSYLERFHDFASEDVAMETKQGEGYQKHLNALRSYLVSYLRKIKPLEDIDGLVEGLEEEFEEKWKVGEVRGWEDQGERFASSSASSSKTASSSTSTAPAAPIPRPADDTGIWCEACGKSFSKQTVFDGHLQGNKHKKALERIQGGPSSSTANGASSSSSSHKSNAAREALLSKGKNLAKQEYIIYALSKGPLDSHRLDTRSNVERRAALTERERAAEAEELARLAEDPAGESSARRRGQDGGAGGANRADEDDSDDENGKIYNPKKLPLGWDGRPIPVWLYKLHGLSVEYSCEICSDFTYQGRKNFDRHFTESRHAFGMRALGLPNTKHFVGITKIQDALKLAEKLKRAGKESGVLGVGGGGGGGDAGGAAVSSLGGGGGGRDVEEVEDEQGNTYSRKDYELLKRQGLI
ncbi:hypothetical protein BCV69DRAFT_21044 [Microstroma glucosiphilum]|uniref:Matrin-type domain-containing protein n=1 Tax=Pseudomicrostroma glucosiphilum TaxID=1684307 RepID=A0A316ULQ7_9BASI|nr:hypothetical protein BCV69DRAFT_21044 [Pseudomicrostroma glucosiphilum]PWN24135.1 hypothetical protein BCV69DRAFT_21044 [Pseudomicrostroma glucosiphilum]